MNIDGADVYTSNSGERRQSVNLRRGLNRHQAASYVGVSGSFFDELVEDGRMPKPIRINTRVIWDIRQLDEAFDDLGNCESNPWDQLQ
jgi:predicted DNA-binding transcriptional regulator AlpA